MSGKAADYGRYKKYYADLKRWSSNPPIKTTLAAALSLFLVAFFVIFAIKPTAEKIAELNTKIDSDEEILAKLETKSAALIRVSSLWRQIAPLMEFVHTSIPISPEYKIFLKELEALAIRSDLVYVSGNINPSLVYYQGESPYKPTVYLEDIELSFSVRVEGDYGKVIAYLEDVIQMDRVIDIANINMTSELSREGAPTNEIALNLDGLVYYFADFELLTSKIGKER